MSGRDKLSSRYGERAMGNFFPIHFDGDMMGSFIESYVGDVVGAVSVVANFGGKLLFVGIEDGDGVLVVLHLQLVAVLISGGEGELRLTMSICLLKALT